MHSYVYVGMRMMGDTALCFGVWRQGAACAPYVHDLAPGYVCPSCSQVCALSFASILSMPKCVPVRFRCQTARKLKAQRRAKAEARVASQGRLLSAQELADAAAADVP